MLVTPWTSHDVQRTLAAPSPSRIIIVGGGMAGLELAVRLSEMGADDIVVLEAGPLGESRHNNVAGTSDDALRAWLAPETDPYFTCPWRSASPPHYTGPSGLRRRVGGRSLYWYGVSLPVEGWALLEGEVWPREVVTDLIEAWAGGPGLYERTSAMLASWKGAQLGGELASARTIAGLTLRYTPKAIRPDAADPGRWYAYSPLDAWRDPVTGDITQLPEGVTIVTEAHVEQVLIEGRVRGLSVSAGAGSAAVRVPASTVILAAGTLENTRLAIQALVAAGATDAPRLKGISDHIVQGFFLRLPAGAAVDRLAELLPWGATYAPCDPDVRSNLFVDVSREGEVVLVDVRITGEQLPDDHNWAACEADSAPPWGLTIHAAPSQADWSLIGAQRSVLQRVWDEIAMALGQPSSTLDFGAFENPARTNAYVLPEMIGQAEVGVPLTWSSYLGVEDHEAGTLPLGAVLTADHEFAQIEGLFAAGPSTFPRMGAANPNLTTLALARRLASVLVDRVSMNRAKG